jgi:hypothetical protein
MPVDFNQYVNQSQLKDTRNGQTIRPDEKFSAEVFGQWLKDSPQLNTPYYTLFLPQGMNAPIIKNYAPTEDELQQVPIYVNHRQTSKSEQGSFHVIVSYTFMYAYNGPEPVLGFPVGAHYADSEHVTAELTISKYGDVTFDRLYTSRHNGGVWVQGPELKWTGGDRPTVFSSLNGHASYTSPGNYRRYWGVAVDRCDYGARWDTDVLAFLPTTWAIAPPQLVWTFFVGSLGDGHVDCFGSKSYLTENEVVGEYGASLWPCKWQF